VIQGVVRHDKGPRGVLSTRQRGWKGLPFLFSPENFQKNGRHVAIEPQITQSRRSRSLPSIVAWVAVSRSSTNDVEVGQAEQGSSQADREADPI